MKQESQLNKFKKEDVYEAIYNIVRVIPVGRVSTYGAIAAAIGLKSGARIVGYVMNHSHTAHPFVPAHRVVNRNGLLSGKHHFETPGKMQKMLEEEGIVIKDDKILGFEQLLWEPLKEL